MIGKAVIRITLVAALSILATFSSYAQSTKVKGRVTDSETGEGIPFCSVYFKNTTIGISTDMRGYYSLETRDTTSSILCASILGYEQLETRVRKHSYKEINFILKPIHNSISPAIVKPDNSRMMWIMEQVGKNRDRNNPEKLKQYTGDVYTRMELDLSNIAESLQSIPYLGKRFDFFSEYIDTSVISGRSYLPVMMAETMSKKYHSLSPAFDREVIEASRISGVDENNFISQFTGNTHLKTNFYDNFIDIFDNGIVSPVSDGATAFYNFFLIDSLQIEGRKTWKIRFRPKRLVATPAFNGEMNIDAQDFAIRSIHASLHKQSNVNWMRDIVIDEEFAPVGEDSTWFYKSSHLYIDLALVVGESSKLYSFIGDRHSEWVSVDMGPIRDKRILRSEDIVIVDDDASLMDEEYWDSIRPYPITEKEEGIYYMAESIKNHPVYKVGYAFLVAGVDGFLDIGKIGFGPLMQIYSSNNLEGKRVQMGLRTSTKFSRKFRAMGYMAYGTEDKELKYGGTFEYMFSRNPTRKLSISAKRDVIQMGRGTSPFTSGNILSSTLTRGHQKMSPIDEVIIQYDHEWNAGINNSFIFRHRRIYSNEFVPMITPGGEIMKSVAANEIGISTRFSKKETVTRAAFEKRYLHTRHPVVKIDITGGVKGITQGDFNYLKITMDSKHKFNTPPFGSARLLVNAGKIFGKVPYTMLKIHEGNSSYILDRSAFSCIDFYEFASDTWINVNYEQNFKGLFFGVIPLVRDLKLRELFTFKAAWGTVTRHNDGTLSDPNAREALILFPEGMTALKKPYIEVSAGIGNILRLFRVDAVWRLTHRYNNVNGVPTKVDRCFAVNISMKAEF